MVIQRDAQAPVWGWADAGENITVSGSWGKEVTTVSGENGKWMVKLDTPQAGGPHTLTFKGNNSVKRKNILSGDVWICSGQSNMEWGVHQSKISKEQAKGDDYPNIRYIKIRKIPSDTPLKEIGGKWVTTTPRSVGPFSAVAYFFGREIHLDQNIPIGLISSNWSGTRIEPWIPPVGYNTIPELKTLADQVNALNPATEQGNKTYSDYLANIKSWLQTAENALTAKQYPPNLPVAPSFGPDHHRFPGNPTKLYNSMINPLTPLAIKGAIWYQGESNGSEGLSYYHKKQALIQGWRQAFQQGDFPFYFVQLANTSKPKPDNPAGGDGYSNLREAQRATLSIKNTGMAVTIDIGESRNVHPGNKLDVGKRLARWALAKDYGKDIVYSGPLYKDISIKGPKAVISFESIGSGLMVGKKDGVSPTKEVKNGKLSWFSICGSDKEWFRANAKIEGETVVASSDQVPQPVAVRYAFAMNPEGCNLYNKEGLPASPFKTDE